ncbi:hypothetical protein L1987_62181 [Smallanthus sonchifolius]|uniref:Uncharacterized protein n=1 Tax=Smallanthus sonchifolius TaxID=185202 RepID=A0ACB9C9N9_9ASTR|nr:hypothetical protein L1987_62181 [Smallanthus sonchifolius]
MELNEVEIVRRAEDRWRWGLGLNRVLYLFSVFPGERFVSDQWLGILRKTGLGNTRDADTVIQCATRIEFLGAESMKHVRADLTNQVSLEIWSLAETLIETILENSALLHDHSFCNVFGQIACVPAKIRFLVKAETVWLKDFFVHTATPFC